MVVLHKFLKPQYIGKFFMKAIKVKFLPKNQLSYFFPILIFITVLASSCKDASKNALNVLPEAIVSAEHFLGAWQLSKIFGSAPGESCNLVVAQQNDGITLTITETGIQGDVLLTSISDDIVASVKNPNSGLWHILKIVLEDQGSKIKIYNLNLGELKIAFANNTLTGNNIDLGGQFSPRLTGTGADLRDYIESNPNSFDSIPCLIFEKSI